MKQTPSGWEAFLFEILKSLSVKNGSRDIFKSYLFWEKYSPFFLFIRSGDLKKVHNFHKNGFISPSICFLRSISFMAYCSICFSCSVSGFWNFYAVAFVINRDKYYDTVRFLFEILSFDIAGKNIDRDVHTRLSGVNYLSLHFYDMPDFYG